MTVIEAIKEGFKTTYRNWPLILIQFAVQIILVLLFIVPILFILFSLGFYAGLLRGEFAPEVFLSGISEHPLLMVICGLFFLLIWIGAILLGIFLRGGIKGIFKDTLIEKERFALRKFFRYGGYFFKRLFLLWLLFFLTFYILFLIFGGIFGLPIYLLVQKCHETGMIFGVLLGILGFFLFLLALLAFGLIFSYSGIIIVVEDSILRRAVKKAFSFIRRNLGPVLGLFFLFILITIGVMGVFISLDLLLKIPTSIPGLGTGMVILLLPLRLLFNVIQSGVQIYLALFSIASTMVLYLNLSKK
ncbi:hypothetical protein L6386_00920 [bacterium]|nr:hypothetical protein [bacterium]